MGFESKISDEVAREPQLPALRFSLKHLFWCVTGACLLLAALVASSQADNLAPAALLLAAIAVALHVGGTAIGTRLRAHANERRDWEAVRTPVDAFALGPPLVLPRPTMCEPRARSPLHSHDRPLRRLRLCVMAGALFGGGLGVAALLVAIGDQSTVAGVAVGSISMAVLGGWLAFVAANSWTIFRSGWRDAVAEHGRDETGGRGGV